uniref:Uncharacterized protein n=1 Tax=Diacronema lutheri TaxID=2081491 RepID=A0A7R9UN66_DIALT
MSLRRASAVRSSAAVAHPVRTPPRPARSAVLLNGADDGGAPAAALGALGVFASLVCFVSEFTLKTTGCGLPAGPGGLYGAVEGLSYLAIVALIGWSVATKVQTGKGLPAGPFGLLGAAEGLAYLAALAGIVIAGLTVVDYGSIPNAVPSEGARCS